MTKPLRMAGVVVVAVLAIALPSLALGSSKPAATKRGPTAATIMCPLAGGTSIVLKVVTKVRSRHHHHHRRHHRHEKPPVNHGSTGPTGTTIHCSPLPCIYSGAGATGPSGATFPCRPPPCLGATGSTGATWPQAVTPFCRPIPCFYSTAAGASGPSGDTGVSCPPIACPTTAAGQNSAAIFCRPHPCPMAGTIKQGATSTAIVACPPLPVCPLANSGTSACPPPCATAGASDQPAPNSASTVCIPGCPPEPVAGPVRTVLHACPEAGASTSVASSQRLS